MRRAGLRGAGYPHVQIVLSTSWARHLPFEQVRDFLPVPLRRRVTGSTWHRIRHDPEFKPQFAVLVLA
ncbi:HAD domain-containing protein [Cupriavidus pauculus]|uniref:HAD domain-containing protein n=1 Tax=Cupriavidus pauculus TaxID=82633 RepID=UPI0032E7FE9D